jgi:hypothetical protein
MDTSASSSSRFAAAAVVVAALLLLQPVLSSAGGGADTMRKTRGGYGPWATRAVALGVAQKLHIPL